MFSIALLNTKMGMKTLRKKWVLLLAGTVGLFAGAGIVWKEKRRRAKERGEHIPYGLYEAAVKRPLDILCAGIALLLLSPVMAVTAFLVKRELGFPVLFKQKRPGWNGKEFTMYKFRTMTDKRGEDGRLLLDEERLTEFGKVLRSTSLDELPELINILRGDMSIVGPRPLLMEYLPRYSERQSRRHEVRPGLTGLAQVSGRNELSWEKKFAKDVQYVEKITFLGDVRIICKTIGIVLSRNGIHAEDSATMKPFMGNKEMEERENKE